MNVIICGVVKNAEEHLQNNLKLAMQLGRKCDTFKIVIYENNSTDATKQILTNYQNNSDFKIIMEDLSPESIKNTSKIWAYTNVTGSDHPCRMEQISNARNKLIAELKQDVYESYNYVVMIDFDAKFFIPDGILNSLYLVKENRKRVIYANSIDYYDYYALRSAHSSTNLFGPELAGEYFWKNMQKTRLQINSKSTELVPVYSAFNGIGVYAKEAFTAYNYDVLITPDVKYIYDQIVLKHPAEYENLKSILQTECFKFPGGENTPEFYWKNNSGYNKPVICEHVAFNFSLLKDGYDIVINPCMLYWWN